jgi:hypothetical protein
MKLSETQNAGIAKLQSLVNVLSKGMGSSEAPPTCSAVVLL